MRHWTIILCLVISLTASACRKPPVPSEVSQAELQFQDLQEAGVPSLVAGGFEEYSTLLRDARLKYHREKSKFIWFRDYDEVRDAFQNVLNTGVELRESAGAARGDRIQVIRAGMDEAHSLIERMRRLTLQTDENRLIRPLLVRAEIQAGEAAARLDKEDLNGAEERLESLRITLNDAESLLRSTMSRYIDPDLIRTWKELAEQAVRESKSGLSWSILVVKLERDLILYRKGIPHSRYSVSLGRNGLSEKRHSGDYATPEGRYTVSRKLTESQFYRALAIDYPNNRDRLRYEREKSDGRIPPGVGIGGLIEIHGGGSDAQTDGCIAMDDEDIERLFRLVPQGTPVFIVGSLVGIRDLLDSGKEGGI